MCVSRIACFVPWMLIFGKHNAWKDDYVTGLTKKKKKIPEWHFAGKTLCAAVQEQAQPPATLPPPQTVRTLKD